MGESNRHMIVRGYDQSLISTAASTLLYMLSESSLSQLLADKEICESYKREPTKANYDAVMTSVRKIKTPLHTDNRIDFAHGLFVVLQHIFDGVWQGMKFTDPNMGKDQAIKDKNFRIWVKSVAAIIEDMAGGIHGRGKDGAETVIKQWEERTGGSATDLRGVD